MINYGWCKTQSRPASAFHCILNVTIHCVSDHSFMQFFGDDFLRVLLLRYIFCHVVLRLHRGFKVSLSI